MLVVMCSLGRSNSRPITTMEIQGTAKLPPTSMLQMKQNQETTLHHLKARFHVLMIASLHSLSIVLLGPVLALDNTRGFTRTSSSTGYSAAQKTPENALGLIGLSNKEQRLHRGSKGAINLDHVLALMLTILLLKNLVANHLLS